MKNSKNVHLSFLIQSIAWRGCVVVAAIMIWTVVAELELFPHLFLPPPVAVMNRFIVLVHEGYSGIGLDRHIGASLVRILTAFAAICIFGITVGLLMGYSSKAKAAFDPIIEFYRPIPPLAYLMLLIVWLGIGETPKITLLFLVGLPPVILSTATAVRSVRLDRINGARSLGASEWQVFRFVIFPSCLPQIYAGIRIAFGLSFSALIAAEMIAASEGLGWMARHASTFLRTDVVFVSIFIMAFIALIAEQLLRLLERTFIPWAGRA